jgi:antitoxin component YwqK of YwqJK toxin-antitoxin module
MTRNFFLFICLFAGCQQVLMSQSFNQKDAQGNRNGQWRKFHEGTKQLRYEGTFVHGQEIGVFKFYDTDSGKQPSATKSYTAGSERIDVSYFRKGGTKLSEGQVKGRKKEGKWKYFHPDGITIMTIEYYKSDLLEGERTVYFANGQIAQKQTFVLGKEEGIDAHFSEKGIQLKMYTFQKGRLEGNSKIWNTDGNLLIEGRYKDNKKHGTWKYFVNGKLDKELKYPQNELGVQH